MVVRLHTAHKMNIKTTDIVAILQKMAIEFEVLAKEHEEVSVECFSHDFLWSLFDNCKKHLEITEHEMDFLEGELRLYITQAAFFEDGGETECTLLVPSTLQH